jgi:hypothetical protein
MSEDARRNAEIVDLLSNSNNLDYERAQALTDEVLDRSPAAILDLVLRLIDADAIGTTIGADLLSFVNEEDLVTVAHRCLTAACEGRSECLEKIALQNPDAVPKSILDGMSDFQLWRDAPEPRFPTMHLIFEHGARSQAFGAEWGTRNRHPTWELAAESPSFRFGGPGKARCNSCGQPAIHLLTIDREIAGFTQTKDKITIETCPTCWSEAYSQHDADGSPTIIEPIIAEGFRWKNIPLFEQRVRLAVTPRRWTFQSWGHSNSRQNLSRLGGVASWVQYSQVPLVPGTDRKMALLLQVDSNFPTVGGGELLWGSGGVLYVFWDAETRASCQFSQWT